MSSYLRVQSGSRHFAFPVSDVDQVLVPGTTTPLPGASDCIRGAIAIGGSIYVVADLRHLATSVPAKVDVKSRIVCLANPIPGAMFSILVDRVLDIVSIDDEVAMETVSDGWFHVLDLHGDPLLITTAANIYAATNAACQAK